MASARFSISVSVILMLVARSTSKETCKRASTCSCQFKNGSIVDLEPVEKGEPIPRFSGIKGGSGRTFYWSPCTKFSERECHDVLSCQYTYQGNHPAGTADTTFSVDSEGNVVIAYGGSTTEGQTRQTKITLKCDPSNNGSVGPATFTGTQSGPSTTIYTGTYISKYCCALGGSSSGGLSPGSVLLIIFFPLLLMYFIIGILVNRYGRGIESMPELIPNYSFWADLPFLVKDGVVFTYDRIKTTCAGKCGKSGYAEI